ncbi:hypothetical protein [Methylobacterium fujisawaense]|uniref:hypothetical protein n=1 Tax=Methylobacterium fujisawaense TaxID=107400 RepID=UPI00313B0FF8
MSAIQTTIALVGLVLSLLCVGCEGSRDYRDARMFTAGIPTLALTVVVGLDLFERIWR